MKPYNFIQFFNSVRQTLTNSFQKKNLLKPVSLLLIGLSMSTIALAQIDVRVSFSRGFIGTRGTSNNSALAIKTFPTLGVTRAYFIQPSSTGFFTAQGNDIPGTVRLMLSSGSSVDIVGAINWRGPSGNNIEYFGFIPDPTITPITLNLPGGGTYTINSNSNFGLLKNGSTFTLTDNTDLTGNAAMTGVLDALNSYLTTQQVNGGTVGSNQTICSGSTPATLTSTTAASGGEGTLTYQWQQSTDNTTFTNVASGGTSPTYLPGALTATTYFRREATDGANSGYSNTITVTVTPATSAGTLSGTQTVCVAGTTTFTSTVTGGAWTSSNTNIATVNSSGVITGVAAGAATITYTVTGTGGCANATATRTVTVSAPPTAGTISGTTSFCVSGTSTLSSTVSGGTWSSSNTSVATVNASSGVVTGVAAGTATITYTVAGTGGCANATATRSVTIEALPAAAVVTVSQPTCTVATGSITVTSPTGAGYTYSINGGSYQASANFTNLAAGSYVVRVKNAAGCIGATTTTATINTQPATPATPGTISGSATVNSGTSQTYSVQAVSGATSYTWALPNGWVGASITNSITVQTSSTGGSISVVANANGCTSAASTLAVAINTVVDSDGDGILDSEEGTDDADGDGIPNYLDLDSDGDGIPDAIEGNIDTDGDGVPNYLDLDSDGDGIPDALEGTTDTDGDGIPNYLDLDSDGDGIPDSIEDAGCNGTAPCTPTDSDNDGIPNYLDLDSDNDGIPDSIEDAGCNGTAPCTPTDSDNDGIPNYLDLDSDNDGIPDSIEDAGCNGTAPCTPTDSDNDGIPNYLDLDSDNDGIPDSVEDAGCNGTAPCTPTDSDNDGIPNYLDLDSDNDGIPDSVEDAGCNGTAPCTPTDTDGDGIPNYLDLDSDGDGIPDSIEAGPNPATPIDSDNDGTPDYLDLDSDNDSIPDSVEDAGCNGTAPCTPTDTDGDGIPNYLDLDSDNDGIPDSIEAGPNPATPRDSDNDGTPDYLDLDSDNDGIPDSIEDAGCNGTAPCTPTDTDGDGIPNYLDLDSDNDGIPDSVEDAGCNGTAPCTPTDTDGDGIPNYLDLDSDNDGILDAVEDNGCNGVAPCTPTDTDNDGIPDYLDVDSDGDGCSDANEAYNSITAQGTDGNMYYGNGNPPTVNANGQVVGATYPAPGTNYITAGAAPVITGDPASLTTSVGSVVNFSVTASVTVGTVSYQWQVSTNGGTSWTNIALLAPYSGVTNSVLNINGVTAAMQGNRYRVIAYQAGFICGADTSASATLTVNYPPDAVNDVVSVAEDVAITGNLLTNDTDPNGDPLTVVSFVVGGYTYYPGTTATIPGVGTILINADGTYTFTPVPNFNGTVPPIAYTISDGQGGTDTANLLITVTAVNDAPDAQNDAQTTLEDTPAIGNVLTNDTDIDGNPLTVTQFVIGNTTYPAGTTANITGVGTLVINASGTYTFTPAPNYNGPVPPVTYTVSDGQGGTDTAILQLSITPVNDAPVAQNDNGTTQEDQPLTGNVLTNDTDVDGNPLTVTQIVIGGVSYPAGTPAIIPGVGSVVVNPNGTYTFTPAPNYNGTVPPIQYHISDGQGGTATAILQITVQAVADPEDIQIATTPVCISGTVTLQASTSTVANPVFKWYADATLTNLLFTGATYVTPTINSSTNYYVTVSGTGVLPNQPGNAKVATATILPAPARPTITAMGPLVFCKDDSVVLKVSAAASYQWYKDGVAIAGATTDTYVAKTEGDYSVVITNTNGCSSAPSNPAAVRVPCTKGIHMPTIFTPNGDGKNDVVKPSIPGMKKFECFKVYNRWGNLVFECYNELRPWDGTLKGVTQPAETYIWVVQGFDGQGKPMRETGMITLTR